MVDMRASNQISDKIISCRAYYIWNFQSIVYIQRAVVASRNIMLQADKNVDIVNPHMPIYYGTQNAT